MGYAVMNISRRHKQQIKRFWFCRRRIFVMPVSERADAHTCTIPSAVRS